MAKKTLFNRLSLAFAPICNYDFALLKEDKRFQEHVRNSTLYIISQRPELTFETLEPFEVAEGQVMLHFDIRQKGSPSILKCVVPVYQTALAQDIDKEIELRFQYALPKPDPPPKSFPQHGVRNLLLFYEDKSFIAWMSPESFIQNYLNDNIQAIVEGPIDHFLTYQVHYVGKATEQAVWKRLTGHSALQDILSLEFPFHYDTLPTHEISVLFLAVQDPIGVYTIGSNDTVPSDIVDIMKGTNLPSKRSISLDAEKALIRAMQPRYNKMFYDTYPAGKGSLSDFGLDNYSYQFTSHLILKYAQGEIRGWPSLFADALLVRKGEPLQVIRQIDLTRTS